MVEEGVAGGMGSREGQPPASLLNDEREGDADAGL